MKVLDIIGASGQHAKDLSKRGIFKGLKISNTNKGDSFYKKADGKIIIAPINQTEKIITELSEYSGSIINCSGIMSTNPTEFKGEIDNVHFLFGPEGKNDLKAIFSGKYNQVTAKIIQNTKKQGIKIIESTIEEHDKNMAYTQALTHFMIFLRSLDNKNKTDFKNSKTPFHLVKDMINLNPYFAEIFNEFFSGIKIGDNISKKYIEFINDKMGDKKQKDFGTPNFNKTLERNKGEEKIIIDGILINFIKVFGKTIHSIEKSEIKLDFLKIYLESETRTEEIFGFLNQ